jgi:hypothetical protein
MANLGKIIRQYGSQMKPEGIAIYVYVNSSPGATCAEVAEVIGMGIAALIRHARRMEDLGFLRRTTEKTDKGLYLPATLTALDPLQNSGGGSDKTPAIMETTAEVIPPPIREAIQSEGVDSRGLILSDPLQNSGGGSGTPVAPSKAKNTSTEKNSQPSVEADANAPPSQRSKMKKVQPSKADPRTSHAAIVAVFEVTGRRPDKDLYNKIIRTLGEEPDGQRLVECFEAWRGKGYKPTNYAWLTDWYVNGIPEKALQGNGSSYERPRQSNPRTDTIREYDYSVFDGEEGEDSGNLDSQIPPDEWVAAPSANRPDGNDRRMVRSSRH